MTEINEIPHKSISLSYDSEKIFIEYCRETNTAHVRLREGVKQKKMKLNELLWELYETAFYLAAFACVTGLAVWIWRKAMEG